jgi:glycosyltransferase involved in cell wall biosynthesis
VFEAICRSDIVLVPSREEVTPVVVLEAMTFGKCVVAHQIGGLGEMVHDGVTGRLFRPNDLSHLVEILLELEANPQEISTMGDAAYHYVREHRSLAKSAEQYSRLIEQAFRRRTPKPEISIANALPPIFATASSSELAV